MKSFIEIQSELMPTLQACLTIHGKSPVLSQISEVIQLIQLGLYWSRMADLAAAIPTELQVEEVLTTGGLVPKPVTSVPPMPTMLGTMEFLNYIDKGLKMAIRDTDDLLLSFDPASKTYYNGQQATTKWQEATFCINMTINQYNELTKRGYSI